MGMANSTGAMCVCLHQPKVNHDTLVMVGTGPNGWSWLEPGRICIIFYTDKRLQKLICLWGGGGGFYERVWQTWELHKNMWFLLFWLCTDLNGSIHVWTQISPSIVALPCSALVLHPQTQSARNPHWLCENPLDCVGLRNPSQSWLWWIAPQFGGLPRDFTGLDAHNRLSNPKHCIAIH